MSVYAKVKRGDIHQSSYAFTVRREEWTIPEEPSQDLPLRTLLEIGELYDVSPVTFPAFSQTSASVRSRQDTLVGAHPAPGQVVPDGDAETQQAQERLTLRKCRLALADKS